MTYKVQWKYKPLLFVIDIIGYSLFFWKKFIPLKRNIRKILVIRLDHIGDVLLTTPVIRALKQKMPGAKIDLLIRPFTKELIITNNQINKIHTLNPPWFNRESASFLNLTKFILKNILNYDLVVELHADPRNILLAGLVGKKIIGYNIRGLGFLLTKSAKYKDKAHILEKNLNIARLIGANSESKIDIFLEKEDLMFADKIFKRNNIKKAFCIVPGTGRVNKFWFNDRWAKLADYLIKKYNAKIIFLGGKKDNELIKNITKMMKSKNYLNLEGKTTLRGSAAIIKRAKLLVSPDTGPMHMAKSFNIPLVSLFGPVDPKIWGYNDSRSKSVYVRLDCSFCDLPVCHNKTQKNACMAHISVSDVIKSIEEVL